MRNSPNVDHLTVIVGQPIERVGRDAIVAMPAGYERDNCFAELVDATHSHAAQHFTASLDAASSF